MLPVPGLVAMSWSFLTDDDVWGAAEYDLVVESMERALLEHAHGTLVAPPRWTVDVADDARLVFTAGSARATGVSGFRVYETFADRTDDHEQLVAVWDAADGRFLGLLVGHATGVLRTGGIGGVAADALAREDATTLGVLGSGAQARAQVESIDAVRDLQAVRIYSPTAAHRRALAEKLDERLGPSVAAVDDPRDAVEPADVLVTATDSTEPVFESDWLALGTHVNALGPKFEELCELPPALSDRADRIVADSLAQVDAYPRPFFVDSERIDGLGPIVAGDQAGRGGDGEVTLFCSVGLAGTEVVLADELLEAAPGT